MIGFKFFFGLLYLSDMFDIIMLVLFVVYVFVDEFVLVWVVVVGDMVVYELLYWCYVLCVFVVLWCLCGG